MMGRSLGFPIQKQRQPLCTTYKHTSIRSTRTHRNCWHSTQGHSQGRQRRDNTRHTHTRRVHEEATGDVKRQTRTFTLHTDRQRRRRRQTNRTPENAAICVQFRDTHATLRQHIHAQQGTGGGARGTTLEILSAPHTATNTQSMNGHDRREYARGGATLLRILRGDMTASGRAGRVVLRDESQ